MPGQRHEQASINIESMSKVQENLHECITSNSTPIFRSQRLKLPRPQRCSFRPMPSSRPPMSSYLADRSANPGPLHAPLPEGSPSTSSAAPPAAPHPHPLCTSYSTTAHASYPPDTTASSKQTETTCTQDQQPQVSIGNSEFCATLALPPKATHAAGVNVDPPVQEDRGQLSRNTCRDTPAGRAGSHSGTAQSHPSAQPQQSKLVVPQHTSELSQSNLHDCVSLPFPMFEAKAFQRAFQLTAPNSTALRLSPPMVGTIPLTYKHTSATAKVQQDAATVAAAASAPGAPLAFGIGVNTQRHPLTRRLQRRPQVPPRTSSPSCGTARITQQASGSVSHTSGGVAGTDARQRPASEPLHRSPHRSSCTKQQGGNVEQQSLRLLQKMSSQMGEGSCGRLRSSALESLLDSLELGVHQADVVLPVHIYLPPIKPKLNKPPEKFLLTLPGTKCDNLQFTASSSASRTSPHSPSPIATPTKTGGLKLGLTPEPTHELESPVSPSGACQRSPALRPDSEVLWSSGTLLDPCVEPTASTSMSMSRSFPAHSSVSRLKPASRHLAKTSSIPLRALHIKRLMAPASEGDEAEKLPASGGVPNEQSSLPDSALWSSHSLAGACLPCSPPSPSPHLPHMHLYHTLNSPSCRCGIIKTSSSGSTRQSERFLTHGKHGGTGRCRTSAEEHDSLPVPASCLGVSVSPRSVAGKREGLSGDRSAERCCPTAVQPCDRNRIRVGTSLRPGLSWKRAYGFPQKLPASVAPESLELLDTKQKRRGCGVTALLGCLKKLLCSAQDNSGAGQD